MTLSVLTLFTLAVPAIVARDEYVSELHAGVAEYHADQISQAIERWRRCLELRPETAECARRLAAAQARLGDLDAAFARLSDYVEWGGAELHAIEADPALAELTVDPRFAALRSDLNANFERSLDARRAAAMAHRETNRAKAALLDASPVLWLDGHVSAIYRAAISPDQERVATVSIAGTALLWDSWSGELLARLGVHSPASSEEGKSEVSFSPDGEQVLLFDSPACEASLLDGRGGEELHTLILGQELVVAADFLPNGDVVTADERGSLRTWDGRSGALLTTVHTGVPIEFLQIGADGRMLIRGADGRCRLRGPDTGQVLRTFGDRRATSRACEYLHDGRVLTLDDDGATRVWSEAEPASLVFPGRPSGVSEDLVRGTLSPDGTRLVTFDGPGLHLWDAHTAASVARLPIPSRLGSPLAWQADGNLLVSFGLLLEERHGTDGSAVGSLRASFAVSCVEVFQDGRLMLGTAGGHCYVLRPGDDFVPLIPHAAGVLAMNSEKRGVVFAGIAGAAPLHSGTGSWVPSLGPSVSRTARWWSLETGAALGSVDLEGRLSFDAHELRDGRWLLLVQGGPAMSRILGAEFETLERLDVRGYTAAVAPHEERVAYVRGPLDMGRGAGIELKIDLRTMSSELVASYSGIAVSPYSRLQLPRPVFSPGDGVYLVTAHDDHVLRIWDGFDGSAVGELEGHIRNVGGLEFSPNGELLLSFGADGSARLWDMQFLEPLRVLEAREGPVLHATFSPDGDLVATVGHEGRVRLWDVDSGAGRPLQEGHGGAVYGLEFHPGGELLLSAGVDGTARLWDVTSGTETARMSAHMGPISRALFAAEGSRIVTLGSDATIRVWDSPSGRLLLTHVEYADRGWLSFTPGGYYVAGGQAAEWARIQVRGRSYPLSSYAVSHESPEKVAASLAGELVGAPPLLTAPDLRLSSDRSGAVTERAVSVQGTIESRYGVRSVEITREGRLADGTDVPASALPAELVAAGIKEQGNSRHLLLDLRVPFPEGWREVVVRARATDERGLRSQVVTLHRRYESPPQAARDLYLLAIGVGDYADDGLDLRSPAKDVAGIVTRFEAEGGRTFEEVHVQTLVDEQVTAGALNRLKDRFLFEAGADDTLIVFVAGHGVRTGSGDYYFLTPESTLDDPYEGIPREMLYELVQWEGIAARRRLLLIDTCHAGESFGEQSRGVPIQDAFEQEQVDEELAGSGLYIVAGSTALGAARETAGNGVFTRALLDGLAGAADAPRGNGDGTIDVDELIDYAGDAVRNAEGPQRVTIPRVLGGASFPLARVPSSGR